MDASANTFDFKPYSIAEIADIYGVTIKTINTWLTPIRAKVGKRYGRYYNIKQVRIMVGHFGIPSTISLD